LQPAHQWNHCWTISFPPYGSNEYDVTMLRRLCVVDLGHAMPSWYLFLECHEGLRMLSRILSEDICNKNIIHILEIDRERNRMR
jgi:hypothetical protein